MEFCEGGELLEELINRSNFSENDAKKVTKQLLQAIRYCHVKNICHRDIKPENICID